MALAPLTTHLATLMLNRIKLINPIVGQAAVPSFQFIMDSLAIINLEQVYFQDPTINQIPLAHRTTLAVSLALVIKAAKAQYQCKATLINRAIHQMRPGAVPKGARKEARKEMGPD